ncbi:SH3 domain-binding protein 1 [Antechinus flavipes]|uniref:SH3 domain-binding protein 1 n=1 Tax=Antechinus flavipes TaxID=38775 RepID=UPI00223620B5|nr:SH3 domain-binding protein 1 [Antechinus flavipes]
MMKRQLNRMRLQLSQTGGSARVQETAEFLSEDLLQVEQRLEPAKRAAHNVHKRLQACLQGQSGADMEKRVKKLPLMSLSHTMAESIKELDAESSMGKALEMSCSIQSQLARVLAEFEMALERDVLQPLNRLSEEELPSILKHKKNLQKLVLDWNALKSRLSQMAKNSSLGPGVGGPGGHNPITNKLETLKEEEEELKKKVEQSKDEYLSDLYHFATKEDSYANYFITLLELQASYHRKSLSSLDSALAELKESHGHTESGTRVLDVPSTKVYGVALRTHLQETGRDIALPLEACILMLLSEGMKEEGLFRLAAGASVLKRLKQAMALNPSSLEEFCSDPHAVAGALKSYLRELPEPIMTFELYEDWMRAANLKDPMARLEGLREVCGKLPQENLCNLRYLIKFLARLAKEQEVNKMTPSNIAIVLGPNLLWPPTRDGDQAQLDAASVSSIQVVGVVEALIQNSDVLFPGDINFNVSGLFTSPAILYQPHPQEQFSDSPKSEEFPATTSPSPVAKESKVELEPPPRPGSPKFSKNPTEAPASVEDTARKTKRPAPARPMVPPPQVLNPRSSPPTVPSTVSPPTQPQPQPQSQSQSQSQSQPQPSTPGSPATPRALPRRQAGSNIKAPSVPPPLPPQPPQPVRRLSRPSPASPSPLLTPSTETEVPGEDSCASPGGGTTPPQPRPRTLASDTD